MLCLEGISKTFFPGSVNEKVALRDVSLHLVPGDFCTVIGGNGAGKSTLLNAIAGTYPVDSGRIRLANVDVTKLAEHRRAKYIGRVFQDPLRGTAGRMMVEENLLLAERRGKNLRLRWAFRAANKERYRELLRTLDLGLENRLETHMELLSGGQRQAVTLLMATLVRPELLLLDEPTAALDPRTAEKVLGITERIVHEHRLTTLMITHNMRDALRYGNRLIMMNNGRIVFDVRGEEKARLTIADLLAKFEETGEEMNDALILG
ncbi:MAG: ATP-binding cassette domain-containing protein [Veillonellaceae bacterium]|nr:ATP-binding cassette domain-containing protein [Veillonellaceae bacterium]